MERRQFIRLITSLPLFALYPVSPRGTGDVVRYDPKRVLLLQARVAGFRFYCGEKVWPRISPGDPIMLRREPHNPHDAKAIALYWRDEKLGYIPKADNAVISNLLDQGAPLNAVIRKKTPSPNPRERLEVRVEMRT